MEFTVAEKLGGLKAIISDSLGWADIEGIGKCKISWASMRPDYPVVNYIDPWGDGLKALYAIAEKHGIDHRNKEIKIGFTEEQKQALYSKLKRQHQQFYEDLMAGKIPVKISMVGCDWPHPVLHIDDQPQYGIKTWNLYYFLLEEKYHIYDSLGFIPEDKQTDGADVTREVIARIKEVEDIHAAKKAEEARRQVKLEAERAAISIKILKQGKVSGGDGPDYYADVTISDLQTGESAKFSCRNIFDFGYVINPLYAVAEGLEPGGLATKVKLNELDATVAAYATASSEASETKEDEIWCWQTFESGKGWYNVRPLTEFEIKAIRYLGRFSPVSTEIRL